MGGGGANTISHHNLKLEARTQLLTPEQRHELLSIHTIDYHSKENPRLPLPQTWKLLQMHP